MATADIQVKCFISFDCVADHLANLFLGLALFKNLFAFSLGDRDEGGPSTHLDSWSSGGQPSHGAKINNLTPITSKT